MNKAVPESWSTSNGTFETKKVDNIELTFVEYSASKRVNLHPDIVEYPRGGTPPWYDVIGCPCKVKNASSQGVEVSKCKLKKITLWHLSHLFFLSPHTRSHVQVCLLSICNQWKLFWHSSTLVPACSRYIQTLENSGNKIKKIKKNPIAMMANANGHNSAPHGRIMAYDSLFKI